MYTAEEMESTMVYVGSGNWQNGIQVICQNLQILSAISKDLSDLVFLCQFLASTYLKSSNAIAVFTRPLLHWYLYTIQVARTSQS